MSREAFSRIRQTLRIQHDSWSRTVGKGPGFTIFAFLSQRNLSPLPSSATFQNDRRTENLQLFLAIDRIYDTMTTIIGCFPSTDRAIDSGYYSQQPGSQGGE